jgi:6-phosphogluconolactonase
LKRLGLLAAAFAALAPVAVLAAAGGPPRHTVYVGSYGPAAEPAIHQLELDAATGELNFVRATSGLANPSFLAFHPGRAYLYAVSEVADFQGKQTGAVAAFAIDEKTGALTLLGRQPSEGEGPCHLTLDPEGRHAFVANYGSGTAAVLPVGRDGRLSPATSVVRHSGSSAVAGRQDGPHAHSIDLDPARRLVLVADLGLDKLMAYRFDPVRGLLAPAASPFAALPPGSGPRHVALAPGGGFVYVVNELSSRVAAFAFGGAREALRSLGEVSTLPPGHTGENYPAEIAVSRDGRFLYVSNRGHDSIAAFAVETGGGLRPLGHTPTGGRWPRHFSLEAGGRFLLVANQRSDSVVVFRVDPATGALTPTPGKVSVEQPACVLVRPSLR